MINIIGSFLIVIVMGPSLQRGIVPADLRLILATGVMGGFTTYSSFNYETLRLFAAARAGLRCCTSAARCSAASRPGAGVRAAAPLLPEVVGLRRGVAAATTVFID